MSGLASALTENLRAIVTIARIHLMPHIPAFLARHRGLQT
jgi:hypothetical protein